VNGYFLASSEQFVSRKSWSVCVIAVWCQISEQAILLRKPKFRFDEEEFEDTKGVIRIRISKKKRQSNGQKKKKQKDKQRSTKHTYKTKDRVTRTPNIFHSHLLVK
jgi:hypothetical protein